MEKNGIIRRRLLAKKFVSTFWEFEVLGAL